MGKFYVYAHIDKETKVPFYVGIGQGKRAFDKSRNDFWKSFIEKYSQDYKVELIAENIEEEEALSLENLFITKLGKAQNGSGILLNWTDGGYAEGVYFNLSFDDDNNIPIDKISDYGKNLLSKKIDDFNLEKIDIFLNEILENKSKELKEKTITEIYKKTKPRSSWIVPFCIKQPFKKKDNFNLRITELSELKEQVNKPIKWKDLPNREFVDMIIHKVMIYFDVLLQKNVLLERDGNTISKADKEWYFYKDYWKAYIKIIQANNKGLNLDVKYIGRNKKDQKRKDIHNFEITIT
jgi:hypothetical protein